jgi:uncharacterized protein GlcG (DUF336 family)
MSNRFHPKYHRKNHHTYGNPTNPDASHDPIASPDQPFLGDFSLQGALCAVAPASAYAGYFYSSKTGIRTIGGEIGLAAFSFNTPLSTAFGKNIMHGTVGINKNSISSGFVLDVLGNTNLDGNLNVVGDVDIDGGDLTASTSTFNLLNTSPTTTINFGGNASTINIGNDTISTVNINGDTESTSCTTGALVVDGGVGIAKNLNICGNVGISGDTTIDGNLIVKKDVDIQGGDLTASVGSTFNLLNTSPTTTINFGGNATSIEMAKADSTSVVHINGTKESTSTTTGALVVDGGVGIAKNLNVGGKLVLNGTDQSTTCSNGALVVKGGVGIEKNLNVCGNVGISGDLTVKGQYTYLHTQVQVTSAIDVINTGTGPALRVTQSGNEPIAHFIDTNGDDIVFNDNGFVGIGTMSPSTKLEIANSSNGLNGTWNGGTDFIKLFAYNANFSEQAISFQETGTNVGAKIGVKNGANGAYDIIFANRETTSTTSTITEKLRIKTNGNVGIGISNPTEKLTVIGRVSATGFRSNQGVPSAVDSSTNGYAFGLDGDTGLFSPIGTGGAGNGNISLFSNGAEQLRAGGGTINIYGSLTTEGNLIVGGTLINDPHAPISTSTTYNVTQNDHNKTILAGHATTTININLPSGLKAGTQVSVIKTLAGTVQFAKGTGLPAMSSTPDNTFTKLAFRNSAASAYWSGTTWYLVGDLLS